MGSVRQAVETLTNDSSLFTLAAPPLLTAYCSINPVIHDIAGQMLSQRTHWIDPGQLNDFFIPCVSAHELKSEEKRGAEDFLYGLSAANLRIEERHIDAIFNLAKDTFQEPGSGRPIIEHAILSLYGDRIPEEARPVIINCSAYVFGRLREMVKKSEPPEGIPSVPLLQFTIAGLIELGSALRKESVSDPNARRIFSSLVWGLREFVDLCATQVEAGTIPQSYEIYMLLLEYPFIDPEHHFPSREAMLRVSELLRDGAPQMSQLILDSLSPAPEKFDFAELTDALAISSNAMHQLRLFVTLNQFVRAVEEGFRPAYDAESQGIALELDTLEKLSKNSLIAFYIARAQRALKSATSNDESDRSAL